MKFLDINSQDKPILKSIDKEIKKIIKKTDFILGNSTKKFEISFAKYCGVKYAAGCGNGTDALYLAIKSLNLPYQSEVLLPAMSYCSTLFSVIQAGLKPVLVDLDINSPNISIKQIEKKISKKTRLIILVHLYGQSCDSYSLKKILKTKKIFIIEDAAQGHGGFDPKNKKKIGSIGDLACFSFYPGKNLGAYGDAGAVVTNNKKFFNKIKRLRNLGQLKKFDHNMIGLNSRLDTLQAAILLEKLKYLDYYNNKRKKIGNYYNKWLNNKKVTKLNYTKGCVYHQYVIITRQPKLFRLYLKKNNIPFGRHYPQSLNQLSAVKKMFIGEKFKNAEKLAKFGTSIPINPLLKKNDLKLICKIINKF